MVELYDFFARGLEFIEKEFLGDQELDTYLMDLLEQEEFQDKIREMLAAFGAGLLRKKTANLNGAEVKLLYAFGSHLDQRIRILRRNRSALATQNSRFKEVGNTRALIKLKAMSPEEFEYWTGNYFKKYGFRSVRVTQLSADFGVDVDMKCPNGKRAIVQCKRYKGVVGRPTVQQTYGAMKLLKAKKSYVVTTGRFTKAALEVGKHPDIYLLDGKSLTSRTPPPWR